MGGCFASSRLPATDDDYDKIEDIKRKLDECYQVLTRVSENMPESEEAEKAREKRHHLLELISPLIRTDGGIEMVKKWTGNLDEAKHPPILYFTIKEGIDNKQNGINAARGGSVGWLTKPVSAEKLIQEAVYLISKMEIG